MSAKREFTEEFDRIVVDADDTEDGLALALETAFPDLRYVPKWGWLEFDGTRWTTIHVTAIWARIRPMCREAARTANSERTSRDLRRSRVASAIEQLARSNFGYRATTDQWDADPMLLNTPGGVVDLQTGELRTARAQDYQTKCTAVAPGGECPLWLRFLTEITQGDHDLVAYLQRLMGYGLTGLVREHVFAFLYGTGANGKGTFLNTMRDILGDYSRVAPMETFTDSTTDRHPTDLAMLRGARLVISQETEAGRRWAESKIKAITGGDPISARFMRMDFFEFTPQFTLIVAGNHKPNLRNVDEAMRRRLHLVPFTETIPIEKRDPDLPSKLRAEWPGILAWAVEGCRDYLERRLDPPEAVRAATADYFREEDSFSTWIEDCCERDPRKWETPGRLFKSWSDWCTANGFHPGNTKTFAARLDTAGFENGRDGIRGRHRRGIALSDGT